MPIFGGKNQIAARPKNVVEEKDPIIRSDRQQKRVELCGRPQPSGVSGAKPAARIEFAAAIECELQLRPAPDDGNTRKRRRGSVEIMLVILRLDGRKRQTAKTIEPLAGEECSAQLQSCDQRELPIGNHARSR